MSVKYSTKLDGKRVLVLGGTSGIGFCVAEECIELGANVIVASSNQDKVDNAVRRIKESYPKSDSRVKGCLCDLSKGNVEDEIRSLFEYATDGGNKKIDHVVNTAGRVKMLPIDQASAESIMELCKARYVTAVLLAKVAQHYMHKEVASTISLTGGILSQRPSDGFSVLAGFASSLHGLMRGLARDMKPIRVNIVEPGVVWTELNISRFSPAQLEGVAELFKSRTLTNTLGTPENLAESYVYLMKNEFVTGTILQADGGYLMT